MKNKMIDLNNILFEQLERLNDEDLKGEELQQEISRSKSITEVGAQVINNYKMRIEAVKMLIDEGYMKPDDARNILMITNGQATNQ